MKLIEINLSVNQYEQELGLLLFDYCMGSAFMSALIFDYFVRNDLSSDILEILSIEIRKPNARPFVITTWYRPPDSPVELFSHFETVIGKLDSEGIEHVINK